MRVVWGAGSPSTSRRGIRGEIFFGSVFFFFFFPQVSEGNLLHLSDIQKTVVRVPFMDQSMIMPPQPNHAVFGEKLCNFLIQPGVLSLMRMLVAKTINI
jgi:hypothetical protein